MSDRLIDINLTDSTAKTITNALNPTDEERKSYETRLARVLERGLVLDRLKVDLPPEWHGEWVSLDTAEIARMELLGFQIDTEFAPKRRLHDRGDGKSVISDVVHMIQPKWMHEVLEAKRKEMYYKTHLKSHQKEESDFKASQAALGEEKNTTVASVAENIPGHEITERLVSKQT